MILAHEKFDRDVLMHEVNNLCGLRNENLTQNVTRNDCLHLINAVPAFNAFSLSILNQPYSKLRQFFDEKSKGAVKGAASNGQLVILTPYNSESDSI